MTLFDPGQIEQASDFPSRLVAQTLCLDHGFIAEQLYFSSVSAHSNSLELSLFCLLPSLLFVHAANQQYVNTYPNIARIIIP